MKPFICAGAIAATLVLGACSPQRSAAQSGQQPSVELPPELDRVLRDYERAWTASDAQGLAQLFTEDGFVLSPSRLPIRGRSAIAEEYRRAGGPLILRALGHAVSDSVAYIVGAYAYAASAGARDVGKFVLSLRKGPEGHWLIAADMDNGNPP
jgi:ketosteroid isomerase-like protein